MNNCKTCATNCTGRSKDRLVECEGYTAIPPVRSEPMLVLPEDVRSFIERVTLHLQSSRSKTPAQHDAMFQEAYRLYARYDVEGRRANAPAHPQAVAPSLHADVGTGG